MRFFDTSQSLFCFFCHKRSYFFSFLAISVSLREVSCEGTPGSVRRSPYPPRTGARLTIEFFQSAASARSARDERPPRSTNRLFVLIRDCPTDYGYPFATRSWWSTASRTAEESSALEISVPMARAYRSASCSFTPRALEYRRNTCYPCKSRLPKRGSVCFHRRRRLGRQTSCSSNVRCCRVRSHCDGRQTLVVTISRISKHICSIPGIRA